MTYRPRTLRDLLEDAAEDRRRGDLAAAEAAELAAISAMRAKVGGLCCLSMPATLADRPQP
jgi:hypothetical protein